MQKDPLTATTAGKMLLAGVGSSVVIEAVCDSDGKEVESVMAVGTCDDISVDTVVGTCEDTSEDAILGVRDVKDEPEAVGEAVGVKSDPSLR